MSFRNVGRDLLRHLLRTKTPAWGTPDPLERIPDFPDEDTVMLCLPTSWEGTTIAQDSVRRMGTCGHEVWVAPNGKDFLRRNPKTRVLCADCANAELAKEPKA
jgi:hypothetical protein